MNQNSQRRDGFDYDSWDRPKQDGFFKNLKRSYRRWRENRQLIADERRSMREFQNEMQPRRPSSQTADTASRKQSAAGPNNEETDRIVTKAVGSSLQDKSMFQVWREERQMKKAILAEQSSNVKFDDPLAKQKSPSKNVNSEFGIGSESHDVQSNFAGPGAINLARKIGQKLWAKRVPQWLLAMSPALLFISVVIIPGQAEIHDRYVAHTRKLQTGLPEVITNQNWDKARIIAYRVLDCNIANTEDLFEYFTILKELGQKEQAWAFLKAKADSVNTLEKGSFHARQAKLIMEDQPTMLRINEEVIPHLRDALNGRISKEEEVESRQLLARIFSVQGDLTSAYRVLEPVQTNDVTIAADVLWIKSNLNQTDTLVGPKIQAERLLGEVENLIRGEEKITDREIGSKVRLMMLLQKEPELRGWVAGLPDLSEDQKLQWSREIDQMSLAGELRSQPINYERLWAKLLPFLEADQKNPIWEQIAVSVWALPEDKRFEEGYQWVEKQIKSDKSSDNFLKMAAMAAHMNGQWQNARMVYELILSRGIDEFAALNNLAGNYYKFPPYDFDKALGLIDKAIGQAPENIAMLETKGQILARMGRLAEAREILERCIVQFPNEWNLHNTLAQIYESEGQMARAKAHRERLTTLKKPLNAPVEDSISVKPSQDSSKG